MEIYGLFVEIYGLFVEILQIYGQSESDIG